MKERYAVNNAEEYWELTEEYHSKEAALEAVRKALKETGKYEGIPAEYWKDGIYIGKIEAFRTTVDAVRVLEDIKDDAYQSYACEYSYLEDVTKVQADELEKDLTEAFLKWQDKCNLEQNIFRVVDIEMYEVEVGK